MFDTKLTSLLLQFVMLAMLPISQSAAAEPPPKQGEPDVAGKPSATKRDHAKLVQEGLDIFKKQIRPVLMEKCLPCHGGKQIKGDLNIATRALLMESGMVGDRAESSHLYSVIAHQEEPHMPKGGPRLNDAQLGHFRDWIAREAPYDRPLIVQPVTGSAGNAITKTDRNHWSFRPLQPVAPPSVSSPWIRNAIDRFILVSLQRSKLSPNKEADRRTLIRRAYMDLIGLPPSLSQVTAFVTDEDPQAYEKLIDRLLESPHYGERWARHWMDVARFGESHGYEQDYDRKTAYPYRDFLIRAFNEDLPFDSFVRWQIAGDELAPDQPLAWAATGFLGACAFPTQLTEMEFESARYNELDDMISTIGSAMLGLSVGCARCHDHKYDPVRVPDYYRFAANFTAAIRSEVEFDYYSNDKPIKILVTSEGQKPISHHADGRGFPHFYPVTHELNRGDVTQKKQVAEPGFLSVLMRHGKQVDFWQRDPPAWSVLDPGFMQSSGGSKFTKLDDQSILVGGANPGNDIYQIHARTDQRGLTAVRLQALTHASLPGGGPGRHANSNFVLSEFELTVVSVRNPQQSQVVKFSKATAEYSQANYGIEKAIDGTTTNNNGWAVDGPTRKKPVTAIFVAAVPFGYEGGSELQFRLRHEVSFGTHGVGRARISVTSAPPKALHFDGPQTRTAVANWICDSRFGAGNLLSRVIVNRLWQHHFGEGIVRTPNDFGKQGSPPTHPELLEFLAVDLVQHGWQLKRMHRMMMTSAVYRQASTGELAGVMVDPDNRMMWRFSPRRLEAEAIRDSLLAVSGSLDRKLYGPGTLDVMHPRRSVYLFIKRSKLIPMMMLFDWPEHLVSIGQRSRTITAPQALFLLNHPLVRQTADTVVSELLAMPGDPVVAGYRRILQRPPSPQELESATKFLEQQRARYVASGRPDKEAQHAAFTDWCQSLLVSHESLYIE